ncbi:glycosyltransferase [Bradyrhizobium sp. ORS 111]|uniref:CgeB family protein n=1 Tax=Bradyrhizobium sp. ORS 111 TaxID=1685958 RepID=UPI00389002E1
MTAHHVPTLNRLSPVSTHAVAGTSLAIVGAFDGTHIGASLIRAAAKLKIPAVALDMREAMRGNRFLRAALWRLADRRPPRLNRFGAETIKQCRDTRPPVLIATGAAPLTAPVVRRLRTAGTLCINYSTDDPWNSAMRSNWYLRALPEYDLVFTTRTSNIECLRRIGCRDVRYLPFAYDDELFRPPATETSAHSVDVLFVGGADRDRIAFMSEFAALCPGVALVGGYWERCAAMRAYALGHQPPEVVCALTAAARVNLCLVRRANRDGHVMRSFEIAAIGGCMLVEDTAEHRELFGADGEAVRYFRTPADAAWCAWSLLDDAAERRRMSAAVCKLIHDGGHTYRDRLLTMLAAAGRGWETAP